MTKSYSFLKMLSYRDLFDFTWVLKVLLRH